MMGDTYPGADTIDSRDVEERIAELEAEDAEMRDEDELASLKALVDEVGDSREWGSGMLLIRDGYFAIYAEQLAEDLDLIPRDAAWPTNNIDWEGAADDLRVDYTTFEWAGETYLAR